MSKRVSLILSDDDEHVITPFLRPGSPEHEALADWAQGRGGPPVRSEAGALRTLLQAGADALRDAALDDGYAELAQMYGAKTERAERRTARDRYAARIDAAH